MTLHEIEAEAKALLIKAHDEALKLIHAAHDEAEKLISALMQKKRDAEASAGEALEKASGEPEAK